MKQDIVLPHGTALFSVGLGVLVITLLSIAQPDVGLARSQWSALLSLVLAAPVLISYARWGGRLGIWARDFWTAALAAYLLHFWWAVFGTFRGEFGAIIDRQGAVAYSNFLVTLLWLSDVTLCWVKTESPWLAWLQTGNRWLVFISFTAATVIFRDGLPRIAGVVLLLAVLVALFIRYTQPKAEPKAQTGGETIPDLSGA